MNGSHSELAKRAFWWLRRVAKDLIVALGFGDRLIEYCEVCGIRQPLVWWSPDDLWSELTGHAPAAGDNMPGTLCPRCFDNRAASLGIILRWHPVAAHRRDVA